MDPPISALAQIIAHIESSGYQYAIRFEPKEYAEELCAPNESERDLIARMNLCTLETADVIWAASWGAYQIMGFNLYEQGWRNSIGFYLANSIAQIQSFDRFLTAKQLPTSWEAMRSDPPAIEHFARRYNGSIAYAQKMVNAARELGV